MREIDTAHEFRVYSENSARNTWETKRHIALPGEKLAPPRRILHNWSLSKPVIRAEDYYLPAHLVGIDIPPPPEVVLFVAPEKPARHKA